MINNDEYLFYGTPTKDKIAGFDLDYTLIKPKSGKLFPIDKDDWEILYSEIMLEKVREIAKTHDIVIFTNQKKYTDEFIEKLDNIQKVFNVNMIFIVSKKDGYYRKPMVGMWELLGNNINKDDSFYCGDAAGREKDFAASDLMFAHNLGITFYTPEQLFLGKEENLTFKYPDYSEYIGVKKFNLKLQGSKEMIIMIGYPGSGKSYISSQIGYEIVNQDTLKTKAKCLKLAESIMKQGENLTIDRTNYCKKMRKEFILLARKYNYYVTVVNIVNSFEFCKYMNHYRCYTTKSKLIPNVVFNTMRKKYEKPEISEGINDIYEYVNLVDIDGNMWFNV